MLKPKEMALIAAKALDAKQGKDIKVLEIEAITTLADYFVICTGGSNTQINALCDEVEKQLSEGARSRCTARGIAAAPGSCWTTAASPSMCSTPRRASSIRSSTSGRTARKSTSAARCRRNKGVFTG